MAEHPAEYVPAVIAKLTRPDASGALARPRLFEQLDKARDQPFIWIQSPVGSGKTTLISSYIKARGVDCLWYEIDDGDADPAAFFHYLKRAVAAIRDPEPAGLTPLTPEYLPAIKLFARRYFERLWSLFGPGAWLVLDNYQDLPASALLHGLLAESSTRMPPGISLVIISRTQPPPAFARLRLHRKLTMLGWEELRLTLPEAQDLASWSPTELPASVVEDCHRLAQGWMAGFLLLLEQPQDGGSDQTVFGDRDQSALFEYFAAELFDRAPSDVQSLLLQTAFVPKLTERIAKDLTDNPNAAHLLRGLHRDFAFISKRADATPIYEIHPLLRNFLLARAEEHFTAEQDKEIKTRSARLLSESGQLDEAVELYQTVGDWPALSDLLARGSPALLTQGRHSTVRQWLDALPAESLEANPWLTYWQGMARMPFDMPGALACFERAYELSEPHGDSTALYTFCAAITESYHLDWNEFVPLHLWLGKFEELRSRFPEFPSVAIEMRVLSIIAPLTDHCPEYPALPAMADRGCSLLEERGDPTQRMVLGTALLEYSLFRGQLNTGEWVVRLLSPLLACADVPVAVRLLARAWIAFFHAVRGELETARHLAEEGLGLALDTGVRGVDLVFNCVLVYISVFRGDGGAALRARVGLVFASVPKWTNMAGVSYHHASAIEALLNGDFSGALSQAQDNVDCAARAGFPFAEAVGHLLHASALHREGHAPIAQLRNDIEQAHVIAERMGSRTLHYLTATFEATLAFEGEDDETGLAALTETLTHSKTAGGLIWPMWGPQPLTEIYVRALEAGIEVDYVRTLIRRLSLAPPDLAPEQWPWRVRICTLGRFQITIDDEPLGVSGNAQHKLLDLLKALIALGGDRVNIEKLCDLLWPDADGGSARSSFDTAVHRLRRLLGRDDGIIVQAGKVSLNPSCCWVDVRSLDRCLATLDSLLAAQPDEKALERASAQLCNLYRGAFLAGEADQPWLLPVQKKWKHKFLRKLMLIGRAFEAMVEWQRAIELYERGLEQDPLAEHLYCRLMVCQGALRHFADARNTHQRCRDMLAQTLGTAPSCETQALLEKILAESRDP